MGWERQRMNIRIIGAGALGMMVAARLFLAGLKVELVTRSRQQAEEICEQGLILTETSRRNDTYPRSVHVEEGIEFDRHIHITACTFEDLEKKHQEHREYKEHKEHAELAFIFLMVKQTAVTDQMAQALAKQLTPATQLVCFQNGIGHIEILRRYIPMDRIWSAVTTEGALKCSFRHVKHTGYGTTWLGRNEQANVQNEENTGEIMKDLLILAGFNTFVSKNINSKVWDKLLINAVINPVTALLQIRNGLLPTLPALLPLMRALYEEGTMLAEHAGIELATDLWDQIGMVCNRTAHNQSSMLQDIKAGRATEIDAITGGLLKAAKEAGIQLPTHAALYYLIRSIEQQWEII
jgi:2-dehydropantoate 2-reductase